MPLQPRNRGRDLGAERVAGGDVHDALLLNDELALCALARSRGTRDDHLGSCHGERERRASAAESDTARDNALLRVGTQTESARSRHQG